MQPKKDAHFACVGRVSDISRGSVSVADILRITDGVLAEHGDVLQDEASRESSNRGLPMFGEGFGSAESRTATHC